VRLRSFRSAPTLSGVCLLERALISLLVEVGDMQRRYVASEKIVERLTAHFFKFTMLAVCFRKN
jgi:hypothetical protein